MELLDEQRSRWELHRNRICFPRNANKCECYMILYSFVWFSVLHTSFDWQKIVRKMGILNDSCSWEFFMSIKSLTMLNCCEHTYAHSLHVRILDLSATLFSTYTYSFVWAIVSQLLIFLFYWKRYINCWNASTECTFWLTHTRRNWMISAFTGWDSIKFIHNLLDFSKCS